MNNVIKQQNFGPDQIDSICRLQIKCAKMIIFLLDRVENIVENIEYTNYHIEYIDYQHVFLFPVFSEAFFPRVNKIQGCVVLEGFMDKTQAFCAV